jgi:hypothetical protein
MLQAGGRFVLASGKKYDVAGQRQYMEGFKRDEVDGGSVIDEKLKTVAPKDQALPCFYSLLARLPGLIVGCNKGGETDEERDEAGIGSDAWNWKNHWLIL